MFFPTVREKLAWLHHFPLGTRRFSHPELRSEVPAVITSHKQTLNQNITGGGTWKYSLIVQPEPDGTTEKE